MTKQTNPALYGYDGQPPSYTLKDGREVTAQDATQAAADFYAKMTGLPIETWNTLDDLDRKANVAEAIAQMNDVLEDNAHTADTANVIEAVGDYAARNLGAVLIDAALTEVKTLERPWHQMTEKQQQAIYDRITQTVREAVGDTIRTLATQERTHVVCELEQITIKKGAKAVLEIEKGSMSQMLTDAVGQPVILVIGGDLKAGMAIVAPRAEPDQADLLAQAGGMVEHSDPED